MIHVDEQVACRPCNLIAGVVSLTESQNYSLSKHSFILEASVKRPQRLTAAGGGEKGVDSPSEATAVSASRASEHKINVEYLGKHSRRERNMMAKTYLFFNRKKYPS